MNKTTPLFCFSSLSLSLSSFFPSFLPFNYQMNSHIVMPVHVCVCPGKHLGEKWFVANTCNSTYFVSDPVLMPSCVCYLLCPLPTVLCSWQDSYAHLKTRKLRPRHRIWLTDGLTANKCQDSRPSVGRVVIFILKLGCLSTHWCLWAK